MRREECGARNNMRPRKSVIPTAASYISDLSTSVGEICNDASADWQQPLHNIISLFVSNVGGNNAGS